MLSLKTQRKLLGECVVKGKENPQLKIILDANNDNYYLHRARELILEATAMSDCAEKNRKLCLAQVLLNIVRAKCTPNLSKDTEPKARKPKSKEVSSEGLSSKDGTP